MVNGHANLLLQSVPLRKPVHEHLATLSLINITIGNNTTQDSTTASIFPVLSMQCVYVARQKHHSTDETRKIETAALSSVVLLPITKFAFDILTSSLNVCKIKKFNGNFNYFFYY